MEEDAGLGNGGLGRLAGVYSYLSPPCVLMVNRGTITLSMDLLNLAQESRKIAEQATR